MTDYKKLHKKIFPTPPKFTVAECEGLIKELRSMSRDQQQIVMSMLLGTNTARVNTPGKIYQLAARIFFNELSENMKEVQTSDEYAFARPAIKKSKEISSEPIASET